MSTENISIHRLAKRLDLDDTVVMHAIERLGLSKESWSMKVGEKVAKILQFLLKNSDVDLFNYIKKENFAEEKDSSNSEVLKIIGKIDLDNLDNKNTATNQSLQDPFDFSKYSEEIPSYSNNHNFCLEEIMFISEEELVRMNLNTTSLLQNKPLYSVLIGLNGIGKSSILRCLVDFFTDLYHSVHDENKEYGVTKINTYLSVLGIAYSIDGVSCKVIRVENEYIACIDNKIRPLKYLRFPKIIATHFGAFDKLPLQPVNLGTARNRYDIPIYSYVGARASGNVISAPTVALRLFASLCSAFDEQQRNNILDTLHFIGYEGKVKMAYAIQSGRKTKEKSNVEIRRTIKEYVTKMNGWSSDCNTIGLSEKDCYNKFINLSNIGKSAITLDFESNETTDSRKHFNEIYALRQMNLVSLENVYFTKQGETIPASSLSTGEICIISTLLSVSAVVHYQSALVLLDEPELSLHPNWQMEIIDNYDKLMSNQSCHFLIATHSHMIVSDLSIGRSSLVCMEKSNGMPFVSKTLEASTYGWSAEEVLLKVFNTATCRNRYFAELISKFLSKISMNEIDREKAEEDLKFIEKVSIHLNDIDPMKKVVLAILKAYNN